MKRTKWIVKKKEPPNILIPDISGRILRILTANECQLLKFYHDCAKYQNTDQIYCTYKFIMDEKGLGWSRNRIAKTNKGLSKKGLIRISQKRKNGRDWAKTFIKLFFVMEKDKLTTAELQRSIYGKGMLTKINKKQPVSTLKEPANIEKDSAVRRPRNTHIETINALKSIRNTPSGTIPLGVVPRVKKKEEVEDNLPYNEPERDEDGQIISHPKPKKPFKHLPSKNK